MRFYNIVIRDPDGNLVTTPSSIPGSGATYTSYYNNQSIPGALQIELDIPLANYATPMGDAFIRIWGISLKEISSATQFNPQFGPDALRAFSISVYGGMQRGLPLANPSQQGLLAQGSISQCLGNWIGTDQTLDIIFGPFVGTNDSPKNLPFNWKKDQPLAEAIEQALKTAFPTIDRKIEISPDLKISYDQPGFYRTLEQFAYVVKQISAAIIGGTYRGVDIFIHNNTFIVTDQTTEKDPKQIYFVDLIGQPTWIGGIAMQFKCVMRGDVTIGDFVKLPPAIVTTGSAAPSALVNLKSAFEGVFRINQIRHVGNFRQPDASAWVTTFDAIPNDPQPASA